MFFISMETKVKHDEYFCNCSKASCPQSKYAITKFRNFFITNNTVQNVSLSRYFYIDRYFKNLKQNNKGIPPPIYIYVCMEKVLFSSFIILNIFLGRICRRPCFYFNSLYVILSV